MLNRILFLLVAVGAPTSAVAMLYVGAHPAAAVTLAERFPCLGLGALALALGALHAYAAADRKSSAEAAMWGGLAMFLFVAAFSAPYLGAWTFVALLCLAGTSVVRLADRVRHSRRAPSPFQRRIFA
jgi:peptidoglycan/LPS O-acetylase OafA/YrhL